MAEDAVRNTDDSVIRATEIERTVRRKARRNPVVVVLSVSEALLSVHVDVTGTRDTPVSVVPDLDLNIRAVIVNVRKNNGLGFCDGRKRKCE